MLHVLNLVGRVRARMLGRASLFLWALIAVWLTTQSAQFISGQLEKNFGSLRVTMAPSIHPGFAQPDSGVGLSGARGAPGGVSRPQPSGSDATANHRLATSSLLPDHHQHQQQRVAAGLMLLRTLQSHRGH